MPNYTNGPQQVREDVRSTREYMMPFNYERVSVHRKFYRGTESHGVEMNPINAVIGVPLEMDHADAIHIKEQAPIVGVTVIGSVCTPPGFVMVECDPIAPFRRDDEMHSVMPVRFRIDNLWGMHLRVDQWWHAGLSNGDDAQSVRCPRPVGGRVETAA